VITNLYLLFLRRSILNVIVHQCTESHTNEKTKMRLVTTIQEDVTTKRETLSDASLDGGSWKLGGVDGDVVVGGVDVGVVGGGGGVEGIGGGEGTGIGVGGGDGGTVGTGTT
jgi:hypothetical protein